MTVNVPLVGAFLVFAVEVDDDVLAAGPGGRAVTHAVVGDDRVRSTLSTVTSTPSTVLVSGMTRCSSIMVNRPVSCSSSLYASTVASSIINSSAAFRFGAIGGG